MLHNKVELFTIRKERKKEEGKLESGPYLEEEIS
jgi:hypothetical protein